MCVHIALLVDVFQYSYLLWILYKIFMSSKFFLSDPYKPEPTQISNYPIIHCIKKKYCTLTWEYAWEHIGNCEAQYLNELVLHRELKYPSQKTISTSPLPPSPATFYELSQTIYFPLGVRILSWCLWGQVTRQVNKHSWLFLNKTPASINLLRSWGVKPVPMSKFADWFYKPWLYWLVL